jgi:hypothetical protein
LAAAVVTAAATPRRALAIAVSRAYGRQSVLIERSKRSTTPVHFVHAEWVEHIVASYGYAAIFLIVVEPRGADRA